MKIAKQTIDVLQNFSNINKSIVVKPGSELKTISQMKHIVARSGVSETFTQHFAIYDVKEFLRVLTSPALRDGEIDFGEEYLTLLNGESSSKYFYADPSTIIKPEREIDVPEPEIRFSLDEENLDFVFGMANILTKPDLAITSDGKTISVVVLDKKDPTSNDFRQVVGEGNGHPYTIYLRTENIKVLMGSYDVTISSVGISHFVHQEIDLEYWIATEPDSEFNKSAVVLGDEEPEVEEPEVEEPEVEEPEVEEPEVEEPEVEEPEVEEPEVEEPGSGQRMSPR